MKFTTLINALSVALAASAAAVPSPAPSDAPPAWFGQNSLVPPDSHTSWQNHWTTTSSGPPAPTATNVPFKDISAENGLALAIISPGNLSLSNSGQISVDDGKLVINKVALTATGTGGTGKNYTGPGSIAAAIGAGSGVENLTTSADAASAVAILNKKATNVFLSSNGTANSTTTKTANGPVTEAWAFSIAEAYDSEGDYALAWSWAYSYISEQQNYTRGRSGGYARGDAVSSGQGNYWGPGYGGWGPESRGPSWGPPPPAAAPGFGRDSAKALAGGSLVIVEVNNPGKKFKDAYSSYGAAFENQAQLVSFGNGTSIASAGAAGIGGKSGSAVANNSPLGAGRPDARANATAIGQPLYADVTVEASPLLVCQSPPCP